MGTAAKFLGLKTHSESKTDTKGVRILLGWQMKAGGVGWSEV